MDSGRRRVTGNVASAIVYGDLGGHLPGECL